MFLPEIVKFGGKLFSVGANAVKSAGGIGKLAKSKPITPKPFLKMLNNPNPDLASFPIPPALLTAFAPTEKSFPPNLTISGRNIKAKLPIIPNETLLSWSKCG